MQFDLNRYGACAILRNGTIVSLGWNVWGVDRADGTYCMVHLWKPRLFRETRSFDERM